jgi:hypothetical protein
MLSTFLYRYLNCIMESCNLPITSDAELVQTKCSLAILPGGTRCTVVLLPYYRVVQNVQLYSCHITGLYKMYSCSLAILQGGTKCTVVLVVLPYYRVVQNVQLYSCHITGWYKMYSCTLAILQGGTKCSVVVLPYYRVVYEEIAGSK